MPVMGQSFANTIEGVISVVSVLGAIVVAAAVVGSVAVAAALFLEKLWR